MENHLPQQNLDALVQTWKTLKSAVLQYHPLDIEVFVDAFTKTYELLKGYAGSTTVDKIHVRLISAVYSFGSISDTMLDSMVGAALVITERMVQQCVLESSSSADCTCAVIYSLETRDTITLDFTDVKKTLAVISEKLEQNTRSRSL